MPDSVWGCIIGGNFDDEGGRPSGFVSLLQAALEEAYPQDHWTILSNGGSYDSLAGIIEACIQGYDTVIWMPNIPNDKPKLVSRIKELHPWITLVTSKRNDHEKYSLMEVISRALSTRSNLLIEIRVGGYDNLRYISRLLDPLGNVFCDTSDISILARSLRNRCLQLRRVERVRSSQSEPFVDVPE